MVVSILHKKPYGLRYDCFFGGKSLRNGKTADLPASGELLLVERNIFLHPLWWLLAIFNLLCGLGGSFDDWKEERIRQRKVLIRYDQLSADCLTIEIAEKGEMISVKGVKKFSILEVTEEENAKIKKRISIAQKMLVIVPALLLIAVIVVILAVELTVPFFF